MVTNNCVGIYFSPRLNNSEIADAALITNVGLRMDFYLLSNSGIFSNIGKSAPVNIFSDSGTFRCKRRLLDAGLSKRNLAMVFFQQLSKSRVGIVYSNQGSGD